MGLLPNPLGVVEGGLVVTKDEGFLKKLARRKGKGFIQNSINVPHTKGLKALRTERPANGVSL